jgi:hypothetical protein
MVDTVDEMDELRGIVARERKERTEEGTIARSGDICFLTVKGKTARNKIA